MAKLDGKVAVVTGASKGIGAAIARRLAADGAAVVVNYASSKEAADRVVAAIAEAGGRAVAVRANLADPAEVPPLFDEAMRAFGAVDVLVNNAGVYEFFPIEEAGVESFRRMFDLNVLGVILACREAVKRFGPEGGSIINISSVVATSTPAMGTVYNASKAAVDAVTRSLAKELGPRKIRVNSVNPGMVETEGVHAAGLAESDFQRRFEADSPLGRIGRPDDVAPAVAFLASSDADWITGETLDVAGGFR
ncbi:SDR family NAD(P)-dependent oxidoreductase [Planctomyces sp. SH-PL62]|uniref:SDR family NAD(P)-dependent oxidoreductase n=1 Tax=Planctomyces sp. SH-PL62 TaxID=1636152 RepID=UPI00078EC6F8|nr:glucose 1-dehydrogenase [Planctomyces sp. SH-PL62]AMV38169.1 Glucose 1-dehydrogenase 1 [Planctomyces sp. SH-PL62]